MALVAESLPLRGQTWIERVSGSWLQPISGLAVAGTWRVNQQID